MPECTFSYVVQCYEVHFERDFSCLISQSVSRASGKQWARFQRIYFKPSKMYYLEKSTYSRLPKIDTPKIDTFYKISRNFEKNK